MDEFTTLKKLNTPAKIQDFINKLPVNFELDGRETCMSPASVLKTWKAHCIEGAFLAAAAIWLNKIGTGKPLVVDMIGERGDWDHVIAVFKTRRLESSEQFQRRTTRFFVIENQFIEMFANLLCLIFMNTLMIKAKEEKLCGVF